jgi:hypothetical protein
VYIYFRVILLYLLGMSLSYKLSWVATLAEEVVTLALFVVVGSKFRPVKDNPYLKVEDDEVELSAPIEATVVPPAGESASPSTGGSTLVPVPHKDDDKISMDPIP